MLFTKEFLREIAGDYVHEAQVGSSRWLNDYEAVFEHEGKLYATVYSTGRSECQEYRMYEDDPDMIECPEVERYVKMVEVVRYRPVVSQ